MKITNFRDYHRSGTSVLDFRYTAKVDVEDGKLWWKKKETRGIARSYAGFWFFMDDGKYCPRFIVEELCRACEATSGVYLSDYR